jgi:ABC-type lipoprotein release transport system permease subunit
VPLELRLAWRNVWRNPRRTGLTVAATVFAVFLVVFFVAFAAGLHEKMIEDSVRLHSGHLSVSGEGHLESQTLEQYLYLDPSFETALAATPGVRGMAPRVVGFGLLSRDSATQGVALFGVDPKREASVSTLPDRIRRGRFLGGETPLGIVLGERLSQNLGADLGDQILVYSVAYSLEMAYELFTVVGIANLLDPALDRSLAVISLADAQEFFVYGDRVTEVALLAENADASPKLARSLAARLPEISRSPAEVHTWEEIMPELEQLIFLDDAAMYILLIILVVVVAFGILNTILMSVLERTRELGVVLALGLRPRAVFRLIFFESMLLALGGLLIGLALAIPAVLYFEAHPWELTGGASSAMELFGVEPVMTWKLKPWNPIGSAITIFAVAAIAALYPALKASRGRPVDALRSL